MTLMSFGYDYTPELIYLIEALKTEGDWSIKNRSGRIQNKNLPFLRYIECILRSLNLKYSKKILLKVKLPRKRISKSSLKFFTNHKKLNFHIEISPFDGSKKAVLFLPFRKGQIVNFIFYREKFQIKLTEGKEEINLAAPFPSFAYAQIRFSKTNFIRFLEDHVAGKRKSKNIRLQPLISTDSTFLASALSALIDCEGTLDHHGHTRRIRVRMINKKYLDDWVSVLSGYEIGAKVTKDENLYCMVISGWEDFEKLNKLGLELHQSKKSKKWFVILNSYKRKQISRGTAVQFYLKKLGEIGTPISARDFAAQLGKSKRVINHHLARLARAGLLKVDTSNTTYLYSSKK